MTRFKLNRPLVWLDLETTGLDPRRDRIVEISIIREEPDGSVEERTRRINPQMPIAAGATAIHGITNDDVKDEPPFDRVAKDLAGILEGADLGGFGVTRFDLPLLSAEFRRAGVSFSLAGRSVIDAKTIYHQKEPRDLSAASRYYLGNDLQSAHSAAADVKAARDVFYQQLERYPDLAGDVDSLSEQLRDASWVDTEGKLSWHGGEAAINFGKHRGRTLRELASNQPDYLEWMVGSDFSTEVIEIIRNALKGSFPKPPSQKVSA